MRDSLSTQAFFVVLVVAALYLLWDAGRPYNQTDEFLYSGVTLEMLQSGDYLTPRFGPIELLTKPPLFYWASAAVVSVFGYSESAMRLLPAMSLLMAMFVIFRLVRKHCSPLLGLAAASIYFLCYDHLFNHVYRAGVMEGVLNLLMAVTLWLNSQLRESPGRLRWIAIALALALLTKSAFVVIPGALTAANLWFFRRDHRLAPALLWQSAALFLVVALPWFVLALWVHGSALLDYMIVDQVWKRAVNDTSAAAATGRSFGRGEELYVLQHFLQYGQPWSLLVWPALWLGIRGQPDDSRDRTVLLRLCCGWVIGVLLLFLVARGRWSWYISSVYIPASILIAAMLQRFWREAGDTTAAWIWAAMGAIFVVAQSPYIVNPYEISSGGLPIYDSSLGQLTVFSILAFVMVVLIRSGREIESVRAAKVRAVCILVLAGAATLLLVSATWESAPYSVVMVATPVGAIMSLSMLAMIPVRRSPLARAVAIACPFIVAAGYLAAPLHWSGQDNRRGEIKWVEKQIAAGYFDQHASLEMPSMSLFSFIPVYATFNQRFDVTYDAEDRRIILARPSNGRHEPFGSAK